MVKTLTRKAKTGKAVVLNRTIQLMPVFLIFTLVTYFVKDNSFFWDSIVVGSAYAHWYYNTNFNSIFVPEDIAGYPPLFGMYLALGWKLFGKTLAISHFLMLPFTLGIIWQLNRLISIFVKRRYQIWVLVLVLLEPVLLAQSVQIAPDILLVFLYLFALNSIWSKSNLSLASSLILLTMLSPRGSIMVGALFITELGLRFLQAGNRPSYKSIIKICLPYTPAVAVTVIWLWLHYNHYGWILYNTSSEWGQGAATVNFKGLLKNIAVIVWRFADFGKGLAYIIVLLLLLKYARKSTLSLRIKQLLCMCFAPLFVLSAVLIWYQNPIGHRYFIVVYVLSLILLGHLLAKYKNKLGRASLYILTSLSLIAGHYTVLLYPAHIAKGWDATLAHTPYYKLRAETLNYLDQNSIPVSSVGSAYPNIRPLGLIDLNDNPSSFLAKDLEKQEYILYSNIFNDFTAQEIIDLQQQWELIYEDDDKGIFLRLYHKP